MQHRGFMNVIAGGFKPRFFTTTWKTDNAGTSGANQIVLPLQATGTYDFYVNWGDGSAVDRITAWNQAEVTHTFPAAGTYTVRIRGTIWGWRFNNGGDKLKILSILSWGPLRLGNSGNYLQGCSNLTIPASDSLDMTGTTGLHYCFSLCTSLTTVPSLMTLDTALITNMVYMFNGCTAFNQSVANFNTALVTNMSYMFQNATAFNQSVAAFNVTGITTPNSFENMFLNSGFATANYDLLLVAWQAQAVANSLVFHAGTAKYNAGAPATARAELVKAVIDGGKGWTITDGGAV